MTREEVLNQFGEVELTFTSFHGKELMFRYEGTSRGVRIVAFCGGSLPAVKTKHVSVGDTITLNDGLHEQASVHNADTGQRLWSSKQEQR